MKLLIASDIHGSAAFCRNLIEAIKRENADKVLLLGDILYHGPRNRTGRTGDGSMAAGQGTVLWRNDMSRFGTYIFWYLFLKKYNIMKLI